MKTILQDLVNCQKCNFVNQNYPPITPSLHTSKVKIFFIGENPSWEFGQRIPFDNLTNSGRKLFENYILPLKKLSILEKDIWITDLFKCRYPKNIKGNLRHSAESTNNINICAQSWLLKEIESVKPNIIVTLGDKEVFQRLRKIFQLNISGTFNKLAYTKLTVHINNETYILIPACHPDISSWNTRKNKASLKWSVIHKNNFENIIQEILIQI